MQVLYGPPIGEIQTTPGAELKAIAQVLGRAVPPICVVTDHANHVNVVVYLHCNALSLSTQNSAPSRPQPRRMISDCSYDNSTVPLRRDAVGFAARLGDIIRAIAKAGATCGIGKRVRSNCYKTTTLTSSL